MRNILFFIYFSIMPLALSAQNKGQLGQFFYYKTLYETNDWNPRTIEQIIVTSNLTEGGDERLRDTLNQWGQKHLVRIDGQKLRRVRSYIRQIALRDYAGNTLPDELDAFDNMTGLVFDGCSGLDIQMLHEDLENRAKLIPKDPLLDNLQGNLRSLIFRNADWSEVGRFNFGHNLLPELQEIRLSNISGLPDKLDELLNALLKTYPKLRYLSIQDCGLDDKDQLKKLSYLRELKALNLSGNNLSELPQLSPELEALDVSYNFFNAVPKQVNGHAARNLGFLFLQCNLLENEALLNLPGLLNLDGELKTLSWTCNNVSDTAQINQIAAYFDDVKFAEYASYARRYVDDFSPEMPSCVLCEQYRAAFIAQQLENKYWSTDDEESTRLSFTCCLDTSMQQIVVCGGSISKEIRFGYQLLAVRGPDAETPGQITLRLIPPSGSRDALLMEIQLRPEAPGMSVQYEQPRRVQNGEPRETAPRDWEIIVDQALRGQE